MKKIQKAIFIIFFIISFNLYSQNTQNTNSILSDIMSEKNYNAERDKLTSKINIFTSWKETYKYMRDGKFRFYKKFGRSLTLEFRYRSQHKIYVNNQTPIIFNFEDGSETQLYNIQKVIYNPYLMGRVEYYNIEVKYKFNDDGEFQNFANSPITNIKFNFFDYMNEQNFENMIMSPSITTNWQNKFLFFKEGIDKVNQLK